MLPTLSFAAFVFWLLAVPMNGPLTSAAGIAEATRFFLLPHAATLALIGLCLSPPAFRRMAPFGILITVVTTLALPLQPAAAPWLLVLLSVSGAFVAIEAGRRLHGAGNPVLAAAGGLVLANLLFFALHGFPGGDLRHFLVVALPLLLLLAPLPDPVEKPAGSAVKLWHYLPFVLVFHIVSGLMYSVIYPAYQPLALLAGAELPFYMGAVLIAVWLVGKSRELALIFGIVLGMAAFALLLYAQPLGVNLSMFAMQAGQGFVDLFLLAFLLSFARPVRAFGIGQATLCLGILGGQFIGHYLQDLAGAIAMAGHVVLNLSVLTLYFVGRYSHQNMSKTESLSAPISENPTPFEAEPPQPQFIAEAEAVLVHQPAQRIPEHRVPENIRLLLSEREYLVLIHSLDGRPYRAISEALNISESSVKTYMKRICDKLGVQGRKGLYDILASKQS